MLVKTLAQKQSAALKRILNVKWGQEDHTPVLTTPLLLTVD